MGRLARSTQVNCRQGFPSCRLRSSTTRRTHLFPPLRVSRSKAAVSATDHLTTVLGETVPCSFLLRGCLDLQFLGRVRAFLWKAAQSSGVAMLMGLRPEISRKA